MNDGIYRLLLLITDEEADERLRGLSCNSSSVLAEKSKAVSLNRHIVQPCGHAGALFGCAIPESPPNP